MYQALLFFHSLFRWLVLASLLYTVYRAYTGYRYQRVFTKEDNTIRHWTATLAHIQLMIGIVLYSKSPVVKYFFGNNVRAADSMEPLFFGLVHISAMVVSIVFITIGSAMTKRQASDPQKFRCMLGWFLAALLLILIAIPWPFSPLAGRPLIRPF